MSLPMDVPSTSPLPTGPGRSSRLGSVSNFASLETEPTICVCW